MADWSPGTYLQFADERARPFVDLIARIGAADPGQVVDLGCGPGNATVGLLDRWPRATVLGLDSSPAMIAEARRLEPTVGADRLQFEVGDLRDWRSDRGVDVVVSNATLQWVPGHRGMLGRLLEQLRDGGWLAFQVPGNFDEPSHLLLRELAADARFAPYLSELVFPASFGAADYLEDLVRLGCRVDAWETTYLHVLTGPDPVFRWISATGARPVLAALPDTLRADFQLEYAASLSVAYPPGRAGTLLPFRRIFVVAQKSGVLPAGSAA